MADSEVFTIAVYDKTLERKGWIGDPDVLTVTPRHNQQASASLTVRGDHRRVPDLVASGARVVVHFRDEYLLGGPVRLVSSKGAGDQRQYTFEVIDDWRLLTRILGFPNPAGTISQQGDDGTHDVRSGAAETVFKGFVSANVSRLGVALQQPVTVATDLARGDDIDVQIRFVPLADRLFPLVDQAGIGTQVRQTLTGLTVDCYVPTAWPIDLSVDGGTLLSADWSIAAPEWTRVIVGVSGEGEARVFYGPYIATAAETAYGDVIEKFVDARDIKFDDVNVATLAAARGAESLAEGAAKTGLSVKLAETGVFTYGGDGVHVGDQVTVELSPGVTHTDVLRSATLTLSPRGLDVTPVIGDISDDPNLALARRVAAVARQQREQQAGA